MKLYLSRDRSGEDARFVVYDELGHCRFSVKGHRSAASDKMKILDNDGNVLLSIRSTPFLIFHSFTVSDGKERFSMTSNGYYHDGGIRFFGISWLMHRMSVKSFEIVDTDSSLVMTQAPAKNQHSGYELDIKVSSRELFCVAVAVCANCVDYADVPRAATV